MASTEAERAEFKRWMEPVTHVYSKGMATPNEPAVSKASDAISVCCVVVLFGPMAVSVVRAKRGFSRVT